MKKIMLHGCTGGKTSNFGDFIFADLIASYIIEQYKNDSVGFFNLSNFFRNNMDNISLNCDMCVAQIDALVYIPGGYFGERDKPTLRSKLWHFRRYFLIGLYAAIFDKPIAIVGVGSTPIKSRILQSSIRYVCNKAKIITVRDEESKVSLQNIGVTNQITVLSDMILSFDKSKMKPIEEAFDVLINTQHSNKKLILVHYNNNVSVMEKFAVSIKSFLENHNDYSVVVASDSVINNESELFEKFKSLAGNFNDNIILYKYNDPWKLCSLIEKCNCVLTTKLHVGIVAIRLGKSVLSFPKHVEKTQRLYSQINESDRCIDIKAARVEDITNLLNKFHNKPIVLGDKVYNDSLNNWDYLEKFLDNLTKS